MNLDGVTAIQVEAAARCGFSWLLGVFWENEENIWWIPYSLKTNNPLKVNDLNDEISCEHGPFLGVMLL